VTIADLEKSAVFILGGLFLIVGLAMLVLPGPAVIFIKLGLTILGPSFGGQEIGGGHSSMAAGAMAKT
jgi:hypothetical protein